MTVCTFAGHREIYLSMIDEKIRKALNELLQNDTEFIFYTDSMGDFDKKCESAVRTLKKENPDLRIQLIFVLPYMTNRLNNEKEYFDTYYDDVIIPAELDEVHYKAAIKKRNRWMADRAEYVLAYVHCDFGGAFDTVKYAQQKEKQVLNLAVNG